MVQLMVVGEQEAGVEKEMVEEEGEEGKEERE